MTKLKECNDRLKELIEKKENVEKMLGEWNSPIYIFFLFL
jgi:dynactin complex subunit